MSPSPAARSEAQATSALCSPCGWLLGLRHLGPVLRGAGGAAGPSQEGLRDSHLSVVLRAHFSLFLPFVLALGPVRRTSLQGSFPPPPHFPSPLPFPTFLLGCEVGLFATEGCWGDQLLFWTLPFSPLSLLPSTLPLLWSFRGLPGLMPASPLNVSQNPFPTNSIYGLLPGASSG